MRTRADGTPQTTLDIIRDIIVKEMSLEDDRAMIFNQAWKIPTYDGLFVLVDSKGSPKVLSNRNTQEMIGGVYTEVQLINTQEIVAINIFSRNQEAELRKEEVLMAINSLYAQASQEVNGFKIARISPIENLSALEGAAMLTRYEISLVVFAWTRKAKTAAFYDSFTGQVKTEQITKNFVQNTV